jgi:hypothetical protein
VLFINEENLSKSPQIKIAFQNHEVAVAILDLGSEVNLISQESFDKLNEAGIEVLTLPVQGINLVTAFGKRSKKVRLQALLGFSIGNEPFEAVFLVAPQLTSDVILGCNFMREHGMQLRYDSGILEFVRQGQTKRQAFEIPEIKEVERISERCIEKNYEGSLDSVEIVTGSVVKFLRPHTDKELDSELGEEADVTCCSVDKCEVQAPKKHSDVDPRDMQEEDLRTIIEQSKIINATQKLQLFKVLNKFLRSFTERPGKCHLLKYQFQVN